MKKFLALLTVIVLVSSCAAALAEDKLVVYTSPDFPPFEFMDDNNDFTGFDIDMMREMAPIMGVEVEFVSIAFDSIIASVQSGACDAGLSGFTIKEDRLANVDFTIPYYHTQQACFAPEGTDIAAYEDLAGKRVGAQLGTTGMFAAEEATDPSLVLTYPHIIDAFMDLKGGKLDAIIIDQEVGKNCVAAMPEAGFSMLDIPFENEDYAIAIAKNQPELLEMLNAAIQELLDNGKIHELLVKYQLVDEE